MLVVRLFCTRARITISAGHVECRGLFGSGLTQTGGDILAVRARFLPWPGATVFRLTSETGIRGYVSPNFNQKWLRQAFTDAGFVVSGHDVWAVLAGCLWFPR